MPEVRRRAAREWDSYQHAKRHMANKSLPLRSRTLPAHVEVAANLLYNNSAWPALEEKHLAVLRRPWLKALRTAYCATPRSDARDISDDKLLDALAAPSVLDLVRQRRLAYARRMAMQSRRNGAACTARESKPTAEVAWTPWRSG